MALKKNAEGAFDSEEIERGSSGKGRKKNVQFIKTIRNGKLTLWEHA